MQRRFRTLFGISTLAGFTAAAVAVTGLSASANAVPAAPPTPEVTTTTATTMTTVAPTTSTTAAPVPTTIPAPTTTTTKATPPPTTAPPVDVRAAQQKLTELGFWLGAVDGKAGPVTSQAVLAFQKSKGLSRTARLDAKTLNALSSASRPAPRSKSGSLIEIDKKRQILFVVRDGQTRWVFNTSTGTEKPYRVEGRTEIADTPTGRFTVSRQVDGVDQGPVGNLYRPKYFHSSGIAVHGAANVPAYPASHGCARVTNAVADLLWSSNLMPLGSTVWVY